LVNLTIPGEWKDIPNFINYAASSNGSIKNIKTNRILKQELTKDGYLKVTLYKNGKGYTKKTHRFIALTFIANIFDKPQINHIDGKKINNHTENLEWVTAKENMAHAIKNGLYTSESAKKAYQTKIKKYGTDYLSELGKKNFAKSDKKQIQKTILRKYGIEYIKINAKKASEKAKDKNIKKTIIKDLQGNIICTKESRVTASIFLKVDARRVSESIKHGYKINKKYICEEC